MKGSPPQPRRRGRRGGIIPSNSSSCPAGEVAVLVELPTVRAVCPHDCPDTCSMTLTVHEGRATDLRGDASHPFTNGFLCQKVTRYLERVYHPDRLQHPLRRTGPKGSGRFATITWAEAIQT